MERPLLVMLSPSSPSRRSFPPAGGEGLTHQGFTLIELLIVIAVILILIAIALPNMIEARMRSQVVHAYAEMVTLTQAEDAHFLDHRTFTQDIIDPGDDIGNSLTTPIRYLKEVPLDPFGKYTNQGTKTIQMYRIGSGNVAINRPKFPLDGCRPRVDKGCTSQSERFPAICDSLMVLSKGPDDRDSGGSIQLYPHPLGGAIGTVYRVYSPTNGTYSEGDMYRLTGGIPFAYRFLIGQ